MTQTPYETASETDDPEQAFASVVALRLMADRLERKAVVLCVNEPEVRERARERLYVGMSRATDELVVVGDPDVIRDIAGDAVARRLGI